MPQLPLHRLLFGFGFGNFSTGMYDILLERFGMDILAEGILEESRSYLVKMLVEVGVVGVGLFLLLFVRTLSIGMQLVNSAGTPQERIRMIALRYSYMAFFLGAMIQTSLYHFVIMGLMETAPMIRASNGRTVS